MKILFHHRIRSKDGQCVHMDELIRTGVRGRIGRGARETIATPGLKWVKNAEAVAGLFGALPAADVARTGLTGDC